MLALSPRKRLAATLVLVCGVAASIATSQVEWLLDEHVAIERIELDASQPEVGYAIELVFTGAVADPDGDLWLDLTAEVTEVEGAPPPVVHLRLIDADTGELVMEETVTVDPAEPVELIWTTPWSTCGDQGCTERYELWIERTDLAPDAPRSGLALTGSVNIVIREVGESGPPEGAELMLFVQRIELVP